MADVAGPQVVRTYQVTSLDRGLEILCAIRDADAPMRNRDIVARTGLPKATVSRLVHTLTTLGYLRRIDQGSYVPGPSSSRTGRAMVQGLRLERYACLFTPIFAEPQASARLYMQVGQQMVPVFQWRPDRSRVLHTEAAMDGSVVAVCADLLAASALRNPDGEPHAPEPVPPAACHHAWYADTRRLVVCTGVNLKSVALCVLSVCVPASAMPTPARLAFLGECVVGVGAVIASELSAGQRKSS